MFFNPKINIVFMNFSGDGVRISAIEFFKLCKLCKIYPVVITFEDLKKIVLKNKEFWQYHQINMSTPSEVENARSKSRGKSNEKIPETSSDNSFPFCEFVNAFRVSFSIFIFEFTYIDCRSNWIRQNWRE